MRRILWAIRPPGTMWVMELDRPPPTAEPGRPAAFARLGPESARLLADAMGAADPAFVLDRFAGGRRCYAARVDDALAAYGWVSFGEEAIGEVQLRMRLDPGEAYIWDCATLPPFRRLGLYTALLAHMAGELHREGFCRAWIGADGDNLPSQKGIDRAGFQAVADLWIFHLGRMRLAWLIARPGVPRRLARDVRHALLGGRSGGILALLPTVLPRTAAAA